MQSKPTEPPFDGKPCPMCPGVIRNLSAVVHNFLWRWERWPEGSDSACKVFEKFYWLEDAVAQCAALIGPESHSVLRELHKAASDFVACWKAWQANEPDAFAKLREQTKALRAAYNHVEPMSEAHFADRHHSHGYVGG